MANTRYMRQYQERREAERERERDEARRKEAMARRREEESQRQLREQRRQEAVAQATELETALEAARQQRADFRSRFLTQLKADRRRTERTSQRRDMLLEILRQSAQQSRQEEQKDDARRETAEQARRQAARQELRQERAKPERPAQPRAGTPAAARPMGPPEPRPARRKTESRAARPEARRTGTSPRPRREAAPRTRRDETRKIRRPADQAPPRRPAAKQRPAARTAGSEGGRRSEAETTVKVRAPAESKRPAATKPPEPKPERRPAHHPARREEQRQARRIAGLRQAARHGQLGARHQMDRQFELENERRMAARQARLSELRESGRAVAVAAARRTAGRDARPGVERTVPHPVAAREPRAWPRPSQPRNPLETRIPSGVLSGALPWLRTNGNQIVTLDGDRIVLRGVSLLGLDSAPPHPERGFAAGAGITEASIDAILDWGANVIRVAINRDRVLKGYGDWTGHDYLSDLDRIIERAASGGAYTLLSLRRLDEGTTFGTLPAATGGDVPNLIAPLPDYDSIGMWQLLGERYTAEPAVLFDLYASPHARLSDDSSGVDATWDRWQSWLQLAVAGLRRTHVRALCVASGLDWGADLTGFPITGATDGVIPNLVYAAHLSARQGLIGTGLTALARRQAVLVTEWGGHDLDVGWGIRAALALSASGIGWTAAHWNGDPPLVRTVRGYPVPTLFGAVIRRALAVAGTTHHAAPAASAAALVV